MWYLSILSFLLNKGFTFQLDVCSGCHDVLMISIKLSNITTSNTSGADYCCITNGISKNEAVNLVQIADLTEKVEHYEL